MPSYSRKKNWFDIIFGLLYSVPLGVFMSLLLRDAVAEDNLPLGLVSGTALALILIALLVLIFQRPGFLLDMRGVTPRGKNLIPWEVIDGIDIQTIHGPGRGYYAIITSKNRARADSCSLSRQEKDKLLGKGIRIRLSSLQEGQVFYQYQTASSLLNPN